jgi:hypothetical protein
MLADKGRPVMPAITIVFSYYAGQSMTCIIRPQIFQHPCRCATTITCPGLLRTRWLWYTAWVAVIARVSVVLHEGKRPAAA